MYMAYEKCVECVQIALILVVIMSHSWGRYLQPPATWVACGLESRELLALCLRRLKGLSRVHMVDAGFVWTEPHSRRIKVKLTVQKEVGMGSMPPSGCMD